MACILIIDDNASTRDILRRALSGPPRTRTAASDSRVGLEHQRTMPAEVIITDILTPEQEGLKTICGCGVIFPRRASLLCLEGAR